MKYNNILLTVTVTLSLFFFSFCHVSKSQEENDFVIGKKHQERFNEILNEILYEEILENAIQIQKEKQQQIVGYENLPGTFWVIDDVIHNSSGNTLEPDAYIFLGNSIVLVVSARPVGRGDGYRKTVLHRILTADKYNITDDKLIIIPNYLDGYLENTYLYFGSDKMGYAKYRLEGTFASLVDDSTGVSSVKLEEKRQAQ